MFCVIMFSIDYFLRVLIVSFMPPRYRTRSLNNRNNIYKTIFSSLSCFRLGGVMNAVEWDEQHKGALADPEIHPIKKLRLYLLRPMNIIDFIAILPFYISFASPSGSSLTIFRILRLGRILRLTKAGKNSTSAAALAMTMKSVKEILLMLLFYVCLCVVIVAAVMFQLEQGVFQANPDYPTGAYLRPNYNMQGKSVSPYTSIWASIYWAIVTGTTLGYGDLYPTTIGGRALTCCWICCGILILGLPISIIGSNFTVELEKIKKIEEEKKLRISRRSSLAATFKSRPLSTKVQQTVLNTSLRGMKVDVSTQTDPPDTQLLCQMSKDPLQRREQQIKLIEDLQRSLLASSSNYGRW